MFLSLPVRRPSQARLTLFLFQSDRPDNPGSQSAFPPVEAIQYDGPLPGEECQLFLDVPHPPAGEVLFNPVRFKAGGFQVQDQILNVHFAFHGTDFTLRR